MNVLWYVKGKSFVVIKLQFHNTQLFYRIKSTKLIWNIPQGMQMNNPHEWTKNPNITMLKQAQQHLVYIIHL